jgi:hypothetical protein
MMEGRTELMDLDGFDDLFEKLQSLPVELASTNGGPIRRSLRSAADSEIRKRVLAQMPEDSGQLKDALKIQIVEARRRDTAIRNASNYEAYNVGIKNQYVTNNATGAQEPIGYRAYVTEFGGPVEGGGYRPAAKFFRSGLQVNLISARKRFFVALKMSMARIENKLKNHKARSKRLDTK